MKYTVALYEFKGTKNPDTNWISSVPVGEDEVLTIGQAAELNQEQAEQLSEQYGIILETTSKAEQDRKDKEREGVSPQQAADTAGAAPIFADAEPGQPNQSTGDDNDNNE